MIQTRRAKWLLFAALLTAPCVTALGLSAPASAAEAAGPTAGTGKGCPTSMRMWRPPSSLTASAAARNPRSFTPGKLSPQAQAQFETDAARLLARHDGQHPEWHWITPTHCPGSRVYAESPATRASSSDVTDTTTSANWSGYVAEDTTNVEDGVAAKFTGVSMEWLVPGVTSQSADGDADPDVTIWPGLAGWNNNGTLVQAGVDDTTAWTEILPESEQPVSGFTVNSEDDVAFDVEYDPRTNTGLFFMVNYTEGEIAGPITETVPNGDGTSGQSAEWIVERHENPDKTYAPLANFGVVNVLDGIADQTDEGGENLTTASYIGQFSQVEQVDMQGCDGTTSLATPGPLGQQGNYEGDYGDTWQAAGQVDQENCGS